MPELSFSDFWRDANLGRLKEVGGVREITNDSQLSCFSAGCIDDMYVLACPQDRVSPIPFVRERNLTIPSPTLPA